MRHGYTLFLEVKQTVENIKENTLLEDAKDNKKEIVIVF